MKFAAVYRSFLLEQPAIAAAPADIGTWVRVLAFASERETEVIPAFTSDREWMSAAGVTVAEVESAIAAALLTKVDGGLLVGGFDHHGLEVVQAKRAYGALGGRPAKPTGSGQVNHTETPLLSPSSPTLPDPSDQELPAPRSRGAKSYPVAFANLWAAISHVGGIGNSNKYEAYSAWLAVGKPMDGVANCWGEYIGSLPPYQDTAKHVGRWLKARGHEQSYVPHQPANARPSATGAATRPIEAPRCPPHRDRVIPPTKMGERWAAPGVPCVACKELSAKWGDRHVDENDLFGRVAK